MTGTVFNIQKFCLHDGPGIRTTVFLKGCPLRCRWCHNPEAFSPEPELLFYAGKCTACGRCLKDCPARTLSGGVLRVRREACTGCGRCVESCPAGANERCGTRMTAESVLAEVCRDMPFYQTSGGGMTISGGEPSFQPEFTLRLLELAKEQGISAVVETCGHGNWSFFERAAALDAMFFYDLKTLLPQRHRALTGADPELIMSNFRNLLAIGAFVAVRLPVIAGANDSEGEIAALCAFLHENSGWQYAELMPGHGLGAAKYAALGRPDPMPDLTDGRERAAQIQLQMQQHGITVRISR